MVTHSTSAVKDSTLSIPPTGPSNGLQRFPEVLSVARSPGRTVSSTQGWGPTCMRSMRPTVPFFGIPPCRTVYRSLRSLSWRTASSMSQAGTTARTER